MQEDENGDRHPVAYASKTLNPAQCNYSTSEKECLALVWGLEHFNSYLEGHSFTCITDHRALTYLIGNKDSNNQRLTRWILRLQPYNLKIKYVKGSENNMADLLSRPDLMTKAYINHYTVKDDFVYFNGKDIEIRRSTRDRVPTENFYAEEPIQRKGTIKIKRLITMITLIIILISIIILILMIITTVKMKLMMTIL